MGLRVTLLYILLAFVLAGCAGNSGGDSNSGDTGPGAAPEISYCSSVASVSNPATITAKAEFYAYKVEAGGLTSPTGTQNVRRAEVQILDSNGNTVQCGETDASGNISMQIPKTAGTYTLKVNSRANNNYMKASVLKDPTTNTLYSISASFSLTGSESSKSVTLTPAPASSTGGAFNILDQVYRSNEFLRYQYTQCQSDWAAVQASVCTAFTVAPMVKIFWEKGVSPGKYIGYPSSGISFYSQADDSSLTSGIYLLGGVSGDGACQDTDHFDNSVIIHEYAHFLEDLMGKSNSPGGSHNGNSIIDPRLSWSEGWSNFFQGAVLQYTTATQTHSDAYVGLYRDTISSPECSSTNSYIGVSLNLEQQNQDVPTANGEGLFREVSVSRGLWDILTDAAATSSAADGLSVNIGFGPIWTVFTGFSNSNYHFRNMGLFNKNLKTLVDTHLEGVAAGTSADLGSATTGVVGNEKQRVDLNEYALKLTPQNGATCTFDGTTLDTTADSAGVRNILKSDDFFEFYYDGSSNNSTLKLYYSGAGTPNDLDLYLYKENYVYGDSSTIAKSSATAYPEAAGYELISLSGLSAGTYLINIKAKTTSIAGKSDPTYYIVNTIGDRLCP